MPFTGRFHLGLNWSYLTATAVSDDDPTKSESLIQNSFTPTLSFSPDDHWNLVLQVPLVSKDWKLTGGAPPDETSQETTLGDLDFGARYFLVSGMDFKNRTAENLAFTFGTSLPTGDNNHLVEGSRIDEHTQIGTGAFGPYAGMLYAYHSDPWNLILGVSGKFHTVNSFQYRFGSALLWNLDAKLRLAQPLALGFGLEGRYAEQDSSAGEIQVNTGGFVLDGVPGFDLNLEEEWWLHFTAQIPIATSFYGVQTLGTTFNTSIQCAL